MAAVRRVGAWVGGAPASYSGDMGLMMEGGIQVNLQGRRFSNEHQGYSEQALSVLAQPEKTAFNIFDARLRDLGRNLRTSEMRMKAGL